MSIVHYRTNTREISSLQLVMTARQAVWWVLHALKRKWEIREAAGQLALLDDRELADIGISRSSIHEVVRSGRTGGVGVGKRH